MNEATIKHVVDLIEKAAKAVRPDDAMKLTQAAVNAANAITALKNLNR